MPYPEYDLTFEPKKIPADNYGRNVTIVLFGASGAGKSALINRFVDDSFTPSHDEYQVMKAKTVVVVNGLTVKMMIYESNTMRNEFWNVGVWTGGLVAPLIVFDANNQASFDAGKSFIDALPADAQKKSILIATKSDLFSESNSHIRQQAEAFAKKKNIPYYETSAKTLNCCAPFKHVVARELGLEAQTLAPVLSENDNSKNNSNDTPQSSWQSYKAGLKTSLEHAFILLNMSYAERGLVGLSLGFSLFLG